MVPLPSAKALYHQLSLHIRSTVERMCRVLYARTSGARLPLAIVLAGILVSFSYACSDGRVVKEKIGLNIDSAHTMLTREVDMLISDSGMIKYRLISETWYIYDRSDRREWYFPDGLKMHSYDSLSMGETLISADTAHYYTQLQEWVLIGNVKIRSLNGDQLHTSKLHWQQDQRKVYSNDTTYFLTEGKELRGNRFEAKDDLTQYSIYNNSGTFEVSDQENPDLASPAPSNPSTTQSSATVDASQAEP